MDWVLRDYDAKNFKRSDYSQVEWFKIAMIRRMVQDTKNRFQGSKLSEKEMTEILTLPYNPKRKTIWKRIKKFLKPYKKGEEPTS